MLQLQLNVVQQHHHVVENEVTNLNNFFLVSVMLWLLSVHALAVFSTIYLLFYIKLNLFLTFLLLFLLQWTSQCFEVSLFTRVSETLMNRAVLSFSVFILCCLFSSDLLFFLVVVLRKPPPQRYHCVIHLTKSGVTFPYCTDYFQCVNLPSHIICNILTFPSNSSD